MTKKTKLIACASAALLVLFAAVGVYTMSLKDRPMPIASESADASTQLEDTSSRAGMDDAIAVSPSSRVYNDPPIKAPPSSSAPEPKPQDNVVTVTPNAGGGKDYEVSRPEYSRPPDDETIYDEPEDNGGGTGPSSGQDGTQGGNDPASKPDVPKQPDTPKQPDKPQGGDKNNNGQIYVPGFGWMDDKPSTGAGEVADNAGTGEVIGQ